MFCDGNNKEKIVRKPLSWQCSMNTTRGIFERFFYSVTIDEVFCDHAKFQNWYFDDQLFKVGLVTNNMIRVLRKLNFKCFHFCSGSWWKDSPSSDRWKGNQGKDCRQHCLSWSSKPICEATRVKTFRIHSV